MPRFKIAHSREQGVDLIIVPLDDNFGYKSEADQVAAIDELQVRARSAGLAGTVVPVWNQSGRNGVPSAAKLAPLLQVSEYANGVCQFESRAILVSH